MSNDKTSRGYRLDRSHVCGSVAAAVVLALGIIGLALTGIQESVG